MCRVGSPGPTHWLGFTRRSTGSSGVAVTHGLAIALVAGLSFEEWRALPFPAVVEC